MGKIKALYHDFDPFKCEVMRQAIKAGAITDGEVICGDIKELKPSDLMGFTRCHFFAGGGFWDIALNQAGWGDEEVWTGSCPCPSFSEAGKGEGFDDARHLWPVWDTLIGQCKPSVIFGEQSHAAIGFGWLDLVCGNLEAKDYAVAAAVLGAHSVGAPHRRQRLYFAADRCTAASGANTMHSERRPEHVNGRDGRDGKNDRRTEAYSEFGTRGEVLFGTDAPDGDRWSGERGEEEGTWQDRERRRGPASSAAACDSTNSPGIGHDRRGASKARFACKEAERSISECEPERLRHAGVDLDASSEGLQGHFGDVREWRGPGWLDPLTARSVAEAGATRGFWGDCDWWYGRDDKYRPIGPGLFPLATGCAARVGRLRIYGDSIVIPTAVAFIKAYREARMMQ